MPGALTHTAFFRVNRDEDMTDPARRTPGQAEALLERYLSGDGEAFTDLVRLYEERLYAFLARFTGDSHLAEDVFQQVFLKVALHGREFDRRSSFSTWLFRITRNAAIDELRKRRRGAVIHGVGGSGEYEPSAPERTPLEQLAGLELRERILALVDALPEAQREAFLLKEEAELGFDEIAEIAGCSRDTVKSRFRLAVEKLRTALAMDKDVAGERGRDQA